MPVQDCDFGVFQAVEDMRGNYRIAGYTIIPVDGLWLLRPMGPFFETVSEAVEYLSLCYYALARNVEIIENERLLSKTHQNR